jgi:hypothetical protein
LLPVPTPLVGVVGSVVVTRCCWLLFSCWFPGCWLGTT